MVLVIQYKECCVLWLLFLLQRGNGNVCTETKLHDVSEDPL